MKVLSIHTLEMIPSEVQRDIHYTLRMEHHTVYIFKDENASQYSATISMEDTSKVLEVIVEQTADLPEYTCMIDELDLGSNEITRYQVSKGSIQSQKQGSLTWKS